MERMRNFRAAAPLGLLLVFGSGCSSLDCESETELGLEADGTTPRAEFGWEIPPERLEALPDEDSSLVLGMIVSDLNKVEIELEHAVLPGVAVLEFYAYDGVSDFGNLVMRDSEDVLSVATGACALLQP